MEEALDIKAPIVIDNSVARLETVAHQPYANTTFNNSDEIHIAIQHQAHLLLPGRSDLQIQGTLLKAAGGEVTKTKFVRLGIHHLFSEMRYELNAEVIDRNKNVAITSLMKAYSSANPGNENYLKVAGWINNDETIVGKGGNFDLMIPLNTLFGFAEDNRRMVVNMKHELVLTRANTDTNAIIQTEDEAYKITITKIEWRMPTIILSDKNRSHLLGDVKGDAPLQMAYRSWDLYEYPLVPACKHHVWTVKTTTQLEKPRYVIFGFQTGRNNKSNTNASEFDHCQVKNIKLYLNSQSYPYGNLNLDIDNNQFALLYKMFTDFQISYYEKDSAECILTPSTFISTAPLAIIDCSKQDESMKYAPVDVRLEFETKIDIPAETRAFCLILHDRMVQYKSISGEIKRIM